MRTVRQWECWHLVDRGFNTYFLNRVADPAWFRVVKAKTDEEAMADAERIITEDDLSKPIDWSKQPHSKEMCFMMALQVREELLKCGQEPSPLRELLSTVCRIEWMV